MLLAASVPNARALTAMPSTGDVNASQQTLNQTFNLSNTTAQGDSEALVTLRNMLDPSASVQAGTGQHTIMVGGGADQLSLAQKIVDDLNNSSSGGKTLSASVVYITAQTLPRQAATVDSAEQTFYLSKESVQENTIVASTVSKQVDPGVRMYLVPVRHAVVTSAKPEQLPQVGKLLRDMDTTIQPGSKEPKPSAVFLNARKDDADADKVAEQTFYLSNTALKNYSDQVAAAVRIIVDPRTKIYLVHSRNAIVILSTPDQLALAQKIINDLS
jgi:hypothetical protein